MACLFGKARVEYEENTLKEKIKKNISAKIFNHCLCFFPWYFLFPHAKRKKPALYFWKFSWECSIPKPCFLEYEEGQGTN